MKSLFSLNVGRVCIASICATLAVVGLYYFDLLFVNDSSSHTYAIWEFVTELAVLISSWPVVVATLLKGQDLPMALKILLWIVSGVFWGLIIEFVIEFCLGIRAAPKAP